MSKTCEKCIHYEVCRYPLEWRAFPNTCWKYEEERPHGEWIYVHPLQEDDGGAYMCSVCKTGDWDIRGNENFCPNCGADMRKEGE